MPIPRFNLSVMERHTVVLSQIVRPVVQVPIQRGSVFDTLSELLFYYVGNLIQLLSTILHTAV